MVLQLETPKFQYNDGPMDPLFVQVADIMLTAMTVELKEEMDSTAEETAVFLKLSVTSMAQEFALEDVDLEAMEPHDAIALGLRTFFYQEMAGPPAGETVLSYAIQDQQLVLTDAGGVSVEYRREGDGDGLNGKWIVTVHMDGTDYRDTQIFSDNGSALRITSASGKKSPLLWKGTILFLKPRG